MLLIYRFQKGNSDLEKKPYQKVLLGILSGLIAIIVFVVLDVLL